MEPFIERQAPASWKKHTLDIHWDVHPEMPSCPQRVNCRQNSSFTPLDRSGAVVNSAKWNCCDRAFADAWNWPRNTTVASVAFPAISTGAYRYPIDLAAENLLDEVRKFLDHHPNR